MIVDYYYCATHKISVLPEEVESHRGGDCRLLEHKFEISYPLKAKVHWVSKNVVNICGVKIYQPPLEKREIIKSTVPSDGVLIDTEAPCTILY